MKWERLGAQSSRWTTGLDRRGLTLALILFTTFHLFLAWELPPSEDELYYWSWSRSLSLSYFDHPPMVAYWIRLSTAVFGNSVLAIRLPAVAAASLVFWALFAFTRAGALLGALALAPLGALFCVLMTPDVPLAVFWVGYFFWAAATNRRYQEWAGDPMHRVYHQAPLGPGWWILGGAVLGLGLLSKYTMGLAPLALGLMMALNYRVRSWGLGFVLHGATAALVALPLFVFNWRHGWAPFAFQWNHAMGAGPVRFFEFLGSQILLVGALPFLCLPWVLAMRRRLCAIAPLQAAYYFYVPPLLFFLFQSLRSPLEANWPLVAYLTFWTLAQTLFDDTSFKGFARAVVGITMAPAWAFTVLFLIHAVRPLQWVPPAKDRLGLLEARHEVSKALGEAYRGSGESLPLFAPTYQWTATLRHQGLAAQFAGGGRPNHYSLTETGRPCDHREVVVLVENDAPTDTLGCFDRWEELTRLSIDYRGHTAGHVALRRYGNMGQSAESPPGEH